MDPLIALAGIVGLVAVALLAGFVLRANQTRVTSRAGQSGELTIVTPRQLAGESVAVPRFGNRATLLQFSTEQCARCPATARALQQVAQQQEGVNHVEVDITRRDDLIRRFNVLRTPTVLLLDDAGRVQGRASGPLSAAQAHQMLASL